MYLTRIELANWLPYKGVQTLNLDPVCYAVVAEVEGEEGRSNWSGKTALLEAIPFAMFGLHRKRTEDEWIYETATAGGVTLEFDNGVVVSRSRTRGESTVLNVVDGEDVYVGLEAQKYIERMVGMTRDDFLNTAYFRQKDIARIVYARPGERAKEFASWFRLEALQKAEARTLGTIKQLLAEQAKLREHLAALAVGISQVLSEGEKAVGVKVSDYVTDAAKRLQFKAERAKGEADEKRAEHTQALEVYTKRRSAVDEWQRHYDNVLRYRDVVAERKKLGSPDVEGAMTTAQELARDTMVLKNKLVDARDAMHRARDLIVGEFDGVCPVNAMQCPAQEQILSADVLNRKRYEEAQATAQQLQSEHHAKSDDHCEAIEELKRVTSIFNRRVKLDTIAAECKPSLVYINNHPEQPSIDELQQAKEEAYEVFADADRYARGMADAVAEWETSAKEAKDCEHRLQSIDHELAVLQAAAFVFGKQGAQRVIAERVLGGIVSAGNAKLRNCMIDLEFNITWAREGKGLADVCTSCGHPFPTSQRYKRCKYCDAERGPKLVEKSDILFSERSGAAEDIIGGVIRIEAGTWFKRDRGSQWEVLFIDEPFGALDEANRDAFTRLILAACSVEQGNPQSFVVAHHNDVMSAMPAMIRVQRYDGYSTVTAIGGLDEDGD
jgi:DNA repair exonuclease SbcCD ATPase subunit